MYSVLPYTENTVVVMKDGHVVGICAEGMEEALIESLKK